MIATRISRGHDPVALGRADRGLVRRYGLAARCRRVRAAEVPVLSLEEPGSKPRDASRAEIAERSRGRRQRGHRARLRRHGRLARACRRIGVPVVDGVSAGVQIAEALVGLGLKTSKAGGWATPSTRPMPARRRRSLRAKNPQDERPRHQHHAPRRSRLGGRVGGAEGWNPGLDDAPAFRAADPDGFLMGFDGEDRSPRSRSCATARISASSASISAAPEPRGQGHGMGEIWQAGMGVLAAARSASTASSRSRPITRKSGFALAHRNIRYGGQATASEIVRSAPRRSRVDASRSRRLARL